MDEYTFKKLQRRGPRGRVSLLVKHLIKKQELTDKEICEAVKAKFPEASTSVKCVQYYRYQMRTDGLIPPAKVNRRKDKIILMWELVPGNNADFVDGIPGTDERIEGQYNGKQLIAKCRKLYMLITEATKNDAYEKLYSVPSCALFLNQFGWECIEFQMTIKCKEYKEEGEE